MKTLINVYRLHTYGYADFVRSMSYLYRAFGDTCNIQWSVMHPLRGCLEYPGPEVNEDDTIRGYATKPRDVNESRHFAGKVIRLLREHDKVIVGTNYNELPFDVYATETKKLFVLNQHSQDIFDEFARDYTGNPFHAVHIRMKDNQTHDMDCAVKAIAKIKQITAVTDIPVVTITNSNLLKQLLVQHGLTTTQVHPSHLARTSDAKTAMYTLFDMKLFTLATRVTCYTAYDCFINGFSKVPSLLFNVPYEAHLLNE